MRLFLAALTRVPDLATMAGTPGGATARSVLQRALDISFDGLSPAEVESLRPLAYRHLAARTTGAPRVLKVHDQYRDTPAGAPLFPPEATAGCLHLVRDPRDLCLSLAAHGTVTIDRAIAIMADADYAPAADTKGVAETWGSWSDHARGWLAAKIPRLTVRYEDLLAAPAATFTAAARFCGLDAPAETVAEALRRTRFDHLVAQETTGGFVERPATLSRFFRIGRAGQWREALSAAQVARIERDHGAVMADLGYPIEF
ncbi:sulfotransferase [Rhodospirillum rubrum F11]|nr:sulfotransferase [Rhodospirillum rubrum F11]QXG81324.1 sulfotransferase domain-containing protein [Rhodospirillum rubrum]